MPDPVRLVQATDPHLFADVGGSLRGTVTYRTLAAVVDDIVTRRWPADLVIVTGDIIQDDSAAAYERFRDLCEPLELPIHCIPGNHDVRPLMRAALSEPPFHYCETVEIGNWLIVGIDSCVDGDAGGRISDDELGRLQATLREARCDHAAVLLHHPPLPMKSKWLDTVGLRNAADFLDIIGSAGNVRTAIFGHVHQVFDAWHESIRIIGTPSTCAQFRPFSDEFELDDKPPAYRRLSLNADGSVDTQLIWLNEDE